VAQGRRLVAVTRQKLTQSCHLLWRRNNGAAARLKQSPQSTYISIQRLKKNRGGAVLMTNNSVDAPTLAQRKFRTGELVHLTFSVLRQNVLLLALAGVIPRIPLLIVDLGDNCADRQRKL
jgi:hypothetical protein